MRARITLVVLRVAVVAAVSACTAPPAPPALTLTASATAAPADGLTPVALTIEVAGASSAVVELTAAGPGLLGATHASVFDGAATVTLYAPLESELTGARAETVVTATTTIDGVLLTSAQTVTFALPEGGAPVLLARAEPDRVRAGSAETITVIVDGRRLSDRTVQISSSPPLEGLPTSITLDDLGAPLSHGTFVVPAAATPLEATITLTAGEASVDVRVRFIDDDDAAFDLNGTFAQVSYGVVRVGGLVFLNPDPQCVIAPTRSLVTIEQTQDADGATRLTLHTQTCGMEMGNVEVHFLGTSSSWVDQGFVDAVNAEFAARGPLSFVLGDTGANAAFDVPAEAFGAPTVMGAELANATDALPTSEDDGRVRDADGDGHPGLTVHNSTQGDQYTVSRTTTTSMRGTIESSDVVRGATEGSTESSLLNGGGISPTFTDMPAPFALQRVDGRNGAPDIAGRDGDASSISCADVEAYAAELAVLAPSPNPTTACN